MTGPPAPGMVSADQESGSPRMSTNCGYCGRKLRDAIFCPRCGDRLCCSSCLDLHLALHVVTTLNHPTTTAPPPKKENESGD
jgi:hypothetical protein